MWVKYLGFLKKKKKNLKSGSCTCKGLAFLGILHACNLNSK